MKKILICILTLVTFSAYSQTYKIESNFETGKTYLFTVKRAKIDSREPMTKDLAQLTEVEATFTEQDKRLKCVWKYGATKAVGPEQLISQIGPEYNEMANLYRGFEIVVLFDPYLGGIELLNYEQMKQNIKNGLLKVHNSEITKIDSTTKSLINQLIEPTYSTPEILLSTYFPEIGLYFNLYAQSFTDGIGVKYEYSYPNPFGGDPLPVVGEIAIDSKDGDVLIIKEEEKLNQEVVNRILKEMVERMSSLGTAPIKKEKMPEMPEMSEFTLNLNSKSFYNLELKLISKVMFEKIIEVTGITHTETLEINLIE